MSEEKKVRKPREKHNVQLMFSHDGGVSFSDYKSFDSTAEALDWLYENATEFTGNNYRICTVSRYGTVAIETVKKTKVIL